ncbi:MAG: BrnT family toxin, partial [Candidatus Desulfaltia sp.]|nr:BrnT family toxin [Candidatus Desulfaltia sp.]
MRYYFEWDPAKGNMNIQKHKVSFQRAAEVFKDPSAISIFDIEHSHNEDRWITMGRDFSGRILVVSHTFRKIDMD